MAVQSNTTSAPLVTAPAAEISKVYREGIVAGILGAATIALWFFIIDIFSGRPFYTPSLLGSALFGRNVARHQPDAVNVSLEIVLTASSRHVLRVCVL